MKGQVSFKYVPFFRLLLPFLTGICTVYFVRNELFLTTDYILFALPLILILGLYPMVFRSSKSLSGLFIGFSLFTLGILVTNLSLQHKTLPAEITNYTGIVLTFPEVKEKSNRLECQLINYQNVNISDRISEKIVIYYRPDSILKLPKTGDTITFKASLVPFELKLIPGEFDYANYLVNRGILYSVFLKYPDLKFGGNSGCYRVRRLAGEIQLAIQESFRRYSMKGTGLAVLTALFAGDRTLIDDKTINSYIASGAVHILSVSGMHVGILFMFFSLLLGKRKRSGGIMLVRLIVLILIIWFYAFITGLSPSVIRASVMFTLFSMGKNFERQINSYNILAASAMLILLFDPLILFQVGFQLSYLAVLGIIYFQPRISNLIIFESRWADSIWQLTTVGIAAQMATFPLSLYYFHQFPSYFWITNLLIIPLVWLIMMGTIIFFIVMPFSALAGLISTVVNYLVMFMNYLIDFISKLPGAVISSIKFGLSDLLIFSFVCIIGLTIYYHGKKRILSLFLGSVLTAYLLLGASNYFIDSQKGEILVYNLNKGIAISIVEGHKHLMLVDSVTLKDFDLYSRRMQNFWIERQICRNMVIINIDTLNNNCDLNTGSVLFAHIPEGISLRAGPKNIIIPNFKHNFREDNVMEMRSEKNQLFKFERNIGDNETAKIEIHEIILTGNLSYASKQKWKALADNMNINCHDMKTDGVFRLNTAVDQ